MTKKKPTATKKRTTQRSREDARLLHRTSDWILDRTAVDDELRTLLDRHGSGAGVRVKGFLNALGAARAKRLVRLFAAHELLLERLLDPRRLSAIRDPVVLAKLAKLAGDLIESDVAFLERRAVDNTDQIFVELSRQAQSPARSEAEQEVAALSPRDRGLARNFLQKLEARLAERSLNGGSLTGHEQHEER